MKGTLRAVSAFGVVFCFAASASGQAGAPTQRVRIPGIPDGTSIYAKAPNRGSNFTSIGCVSLKVPLRRPRAVRQASMMNASPMVSSSIVRWLPNDGC